ncbi:hypothetical protein WMF11_26425 [Sorangium sp. So ce295]|uniref:hypothetical protein n=1 Tax=Sorangium sp. So ce295 TaxID=3133295 RepID=UPI003F642C99
MGQKAKQRSEAQAQAPENRRFDEVDQSKGIFRLDGPHPKDAELRAPGSLGGGPYEESGRGGPAGSLELRETGAEATAAGAAAPPEEETLPESGATEQVQPRGALPQHEEPGEKDRKAAGQR